LDDLTVIAGTLPNALPQAEHESAAIKLGIQSLLDTERVQSQRTSTFADGPTTLLGDRSLLSLDHSLLSFFSTISV